jgi:FkbM family methyltransferase
MDESSLARLAAGIRLHDESSRTRRIIAAPMRLARSLLLQRISVWRRRSIPVWARTFWGERISVLYPDGVAVKLHRYGFFEAGLTRIFLQYVKPGMTVFDIGAHVGYFTLLGSRLVGDAGEVHAFEPTPGTFEMLRGNTRGRSNVRLNQMAVYSHEATLNLTGYEQFPSFNTLGSGNAGDAADDDYEQTTIPVRATALDDYVASTGVRPDFIKLDAEGAEQDIFKGMSRVLSEIRPMITIEVGDIGVGAMGKSRALLSLFISAGYDPWEYDPATGATHPHTPRDRYAYDNLLLIPRRQSHAGT